MLFRPNSEGQLRIVKISGEGGGGAALFEREGIGTGKINYH